MFFDNNTVKSLQQDIENNEKLKKGWQTLLLQAEELLKAELITEEYADGEGGQHGRYREPAEQIKQMGITLGFVYQLTGDPRYAQKLKEVMLYYGEYRKWTGGGCLNLDPPWTSELNTAIFSLGYAIGFDCIYNFLSEDERKKIADAIKRLAVIPLINDWLLPGKRVHALDSMGHNWWSVCVGQAGLAAMAILDEVPEAIEWVEMAVDAIPYWYDYRGEVLQNKCRNFDPKGAFYEGVNYTNYGMSELLMFSLGYMNTFDSEKTFDSSFLIKVGDFFLHSCYPTSSKETPDLLVNFGDSISYRKACELPRMILACGIDHPGLRWYLEREEPDYNIFDMLYRDRIRNGKVQRPDGVGTSILYEDSGWAIMRSSWKEDATMLALKSGFTWNHAHADAGSFILFHKGKQLLIDSGSCDYGRKEYTEYYCQSKAHNVILYNGRGQDEKEIYFGSKHPGRVCRLMENDWMKYIYTDATGPMSRYLTRNYRHFLWVENVLLIIDDIKAYESGNFQQLFHYEGNAEIGKATVKLNNGKAEATIQNLFPADISIIEEIGLKEHEPDTKIKFFSFSTKEKQETEKFITAVCLSEDKDENPMPKLERLEGPEMIGVRIIKDGYVTDVFLNLRADGRRMHQNSANILDGWDTDAYILAVRSKIKDQAEDIVQNCFISYGSYLRRNGTVIYDSLSKVFIAFSMNHADLKLILSGQNKIKARIYSSEKPGSVIVNGQSYPVRFDEKTNLLDITVNNE